MIIDALALLLFVLPVPGWVATVILVRAALHRPRIAALSERAFAAVVLSGAATVAAYLASARLGLRDLDTGVAIVLLAAVEVAVSVPSVIWLVRFLRGDFGRVE